MIWCQRCPAASGRTPDGLALVIKHFAQAYLTLWSYCWVREVSRVDPGGPDASIFAQAQNELFVFKCVLGVSPQRSHHDLPCSHLNRSKARSRQACRGESL